MFNLMSDGHYVLIFKDNGCGQQTTSQPLAASQQQRLAKRLGRRF